MVQNVIGAGAQAKVAVDHAQGFPARARRMVRAEVPGTVVGHAAHHLQPRPLDPRVQPQRQKILVVGQLDVEARLMALDQGVLQQERLLFVAGHHCLDVRHHTLEQRHKIPGIARGRLEVLAHPVAQIGSLADVQHLAATVLHEVHARLGWQTLQDFSQGFTSRRNLSVGEAVGLAGFAL